MNPSENIVGQRNRSVELRSDSPQPLDYFRAMQSLVNAVNAGSTDVAVAEALLDGIRPLIGADLGVVMAVAEDGLTLETLCQQGATAEPQVAWEEFPTAASSPITLSMREQRTVILHGKQEALADCPETADSCGSAKGVLLAIPLVLENRVRGCVGFFWQEPHPFPEWEVAFVETASTLAAQAVERARRHEAELRNAQDATRETLFHALTKSEARLAQAQAVAKIGSWDLDPATGKAVWSEEMYRLLEFDPAKGVPPYEAFLARLHPEDVALYQEMERRAKEEGNPRDFDFRVLYSYGGQGWLHAIGRSEKDAQGKVVHTFGTVMDITERKLMEQTLQENDERLRAILDQMPAGIVFAEAPSGRMILSNREMERILGRPVRLFSSVIESSDPSVCRPDGTPMGLEDYPLVRAIKRGETTSHEEVLILRPGGTRLVCLANAAPIYNKAGALIAGVVALHDIDEHKKLQQQFHQAQKMEGIGRLAGGIAHDFNNLLTVIMGYAELIEDDLPEDSPQRLRIRTVADAAHRASSLTGQLLSFARRQPTEPQTISLNTLIEGITQILRPLIGEDIRLQTELNVTPGNVRIDAHQLEQILVNLVVNARDAMPQGGTLTIATAEEAIEEKRIHPQFLIPSGQYISLSVADTGTGMTEEVKARLFDPFFTTKEIGKGTGLGLATVYGILKQNDAYIQVASEVNQGATFTLYFPRTENSPQPVAEPEDRPVRERGAKTVLVVEDEPSLRQMVVLTLRQNGYVVLHAENGVEALQVAEAFPGEIDLLLTDAIMPNMGGKELAERLRQQRATIQVLFASGYSEDRFPDAGAPFSDASFLAKPFTPSTLLQKVREVLAK